MTTAISYGTEIWLAELKRDGWNLTVSEHRRTEPPVLQSVDDLMGALRTLVSNEPAVQVGVLATDENGAGVFVPCPDKDCAWRLLARVDDEVAGVV